MAKMWRHHAVVFLLVLAGPAATFASSDEDLPLDGVLGDVPFGDGGCSSSLSLLQVHAKQQRASSVQADAQEPSSPAADAGAVAVASREAVAGEDPHAAAPDTSKTLEAKVILPGSPATPDAWDANASAVLQHDQSYNPATINQRVSWRVWFSMARQAGMLQFAFDTLDKRGFRTMSKRVLMVGIGASTLLVLAGCVACIGLLDVSKARSHAASQRLRMPRQMPFDEVSTSASGGSGSDGSVTDSDQETMKMAKAAPGSQTAKSHKAVMMNFLPTQADSHCYYKFLLPLFLTPMCGAAWLLVVWLPAHAADISKGLDEVSNRTLAGLLAMPLLWRIGVHIVEGSALTTGMSLGLENKEVPVGAPSSSSDAPPASLLHVVVVPAYNEPWSVLCRTIGSLAQQTVPRHRRCITIAFEACDPNAKEMYGHICSMFGQDFGRIWQTSHVLQKGEEAGKSANENFAVRWLYEELAPEHDPDNVMITIADADSDFAPGYLEQVESTFSQQLNGQCYMYDGLLNTWGNYLETQNPLIKHIELMRCVRSWQGQWRLLPPDMPCPESNYSLTLGLAHRIDFWTPDQMHEDLHTFHKVQLSLRYGVATVPVYSFICNDLVTGFKDRFAQAQRHAWGVTEIAWAMALYHQVELRIFFSVFSQTLVAQFVSRTKKNWPLLLLLPSVRSFLGLMSPRIFWYWVTYYVAFQLEQWAYDTFLICYAWYGILQDRVTVPKPPLVSLFIIRVLGWPLDVLAEICFSLIPFWISVFHAFRTPHFKYVNAPKGG